MGTVPAGMQDLLVTTAPAEPIGVLIAVGDAGPGLPSGIVNRVFDPFSSFPPTDSARGNEPVAAPGNIHDGSVARLVVTEKSAQRRHLNRLDRIHQGQWLFELRYRLRTDARGSGSRGRWGRSEFSNLTSGVIDPHGVDDLVLAATEVEKLPTPIRQETRESDEQTNGSAVGGGSCCLHWGDAPVVDGLRR